MIEYSLWIAVMGPIGAYDDTFFWAHMTQHLMMMMVIARHVLKTYG